MTDKQTAGEVRSEFETARRARLKPLTEIAASHGMPLRHPNLPLV